MASYVYGSYQNVSGYGFRFRSWFAYTTSSTDTTYSITVYAGPQIADNTGTVKMSLKCRLTGTGQTSRSTTKTFDTGSDDSSGRMTFISSKKWTWNKTTSAQTVTITASVDNSKMSASTVSKTFTIPALKSYSVSYNSNGGSGSIGNQTKYYNKTLSLSDGAALARNGYTLASWNTAANGSGTTYELGSSYTKNAALTLYAQWSTDYSITNITLYRCDESGNQLQRGEFVYLRFWYDTLNTTGVSYSIVIDGSTVKSGTLPFSYGYIIYNPNNYDDPDVLSLDTEHTIVISVGSYSKTVTVPIPTRPIDIVGRENDISMGIMSPAEVGIPLKLTPKCYIDDNGSLIVEGHSSAIGSIVTASPSESEASATDYVTLTSAYLSLTAGTWMITYSCYCDVNSASKRLGARLYNRTSGTAYSSSRAIAQTSTTAAVCVTGSIPVTFEGNTSIALQAYQNSGSAKTISGYLRAVRIA